MTTSTLPARYKINGLINTDRPVMESLQNICNACGTFLSYDIHQGKWAVIINRAGTAVKDFNDSNIVGPIQVNGTSLTQLYNSVIVEYPLRDTVDQTDYVQVTIPAEDRYANEPDNVLKITLEMCNEPVQAEIIGLIELKQSRIDQIVTFQSDFSTLDLNAGDIITVTNDIYQFNQKPFRVITLSEIDADDGSIRIEVTALAYDANVYDTSDLGRYIRSDRNGIKGIGAIGTPIAPVLSVYAQDRRPGIQVESVVPAGIVESMELWLSADNTNFVLVQTEYPIGGGTFSAGDTVTFDYDKLESQNIYVKTRGMNSTTTGPFSPVDSFLSYVPVQTTDNISENTKLSDSTGNLATALGLSLLLKKVADYFGGDANKTFEQVVYGTAGGGSFVFSSTDDTEAVTNTYGTPYSSGGVTVPRGYYDQILEGSFTPTVSGNYMVQCFITYGNSSSLDPVSPVFKNSIIALYAGGNYSGSLGVISNDLADSALLVIAPSVEFQTATQNGQDQYSQLFLVKQMALTAGVTYYINTFHCVQTPVNVVNRQILVQYTGT